MFSMAPFSQEWEPPENPERFTEQEVGCMQPRMPYPCRHALASLLGNLELYRPLRLLLHDRRATGNVLPVTNVAHPQLRQITCPKLAVDGEIEHGQIPARETKAAGARGSPKSP